MLQDIAIDTGVVELTVTKTYQRYCNCNTGDLVRASLLRAKLKRKTPYDAAIRSSITHINQVVRSDDHYTTSCRQEQENSIINYRYPTFGRPLESLLQA